MKKIIAIIFSLTLLFSLTACGKKEETAEEAVRTALTAIKNLDVITVNQYFDVEEIMDNDVDIDLDVDLNDLDSKDLEIAKLFVKNLEYKILASDEVSNKATVDVEITNTDMQVVLQEYFTYAFSLVFTEKSEEVVEEELENKLIELLNNEDVKLKSTEVSLILVKVDNKWNIESDKEFLDALSGGLLTLAAEFED